jgi:peptidyl-prolyl cis-trans isomerase D
VKTGKKLNELFPAEKSDTGNNPFAFAAETKPEAKSTGEFSSALDAMPQLGPDPALKKTIFELKAPGLIDRVVQSGDSLLLVSVDERKQPNDEDFAKQKAQLTIEAVKGKQFEVREAFLKALKQSGTVVTNDQAIDKVIGDS